MARLRHLPASLAIAVMAAVGLASAQPAPDQPPQAAAPPAPPRSRPPTAPLPPEEPAPEATAPAASSEPAELPASSGDELPEAGSGATAKAPPLRRTLYTAAVIQVLDKVTAEGLRFEAPLHRFVRYKGLIFLVNTCQSGEPDDPSQPAAAHLEVDSQAPALAGHPPNPVKLVFRGWMFADNPGVHPLEHPIYDAWLIACKTASGGA